MRRLPTAKAAWAVHAVLVGSLLALTYLGHREDALFRRLYRDATAEAHSVDQGTAARKATFSMLGKRMVDDPLLRVATRVPFLRSVSADLMEPRSCASFAFVLANMLRVGGHQARIAQMSIDGKPAKHMLVELYAEGGWRCLDPSFDASWVKQDGTLASCAEVADRWDHYKLQAVTTTQALSFPSAYQHINYDAGGVRHTNWEAVPLLMPAVRNVLERMAGREWVEGLSVRMWFLNRFYALAVVLAVMELVALAVGAVLRSRRRA